MASSVIQIRKRESGTHWISIFIQSPERGEFFDSFGHTPSFYNSDFVDFLNRNCKDWISNPKQLQSELTVVCGEYCIFYLIHRTRGVSMQTVVNFFNANRIDNDQMVYDYVLSLMR